MLKQDLKDQISWKNLESYFNRFYQRKIICTKSCAEFQISNAR
ncbi:36516_t:CDS:2 [Gigaspora margarita]|uniref:36516_t:CDS:1 n=1 Tax=Gigaspora margarita TaxID=4874 RepID=A0ABM8W4G0_GIGMA|nr:36516_t:CDS:2 [Gigaspora margarita]